jgi:hypothetical protein
MRELTPAMQERQEKLVAASVKGSPIWNGQLELQLSENEVPNIVSHRTESLRYANHGISSCCPQLLTEERLAWFESMPLIRNR